MGDMEAGPEVQDDIILIKADGLPTYNFAHIVDDAEMHVTHVCRGVEYLSSTPNYLALYEAFGLEVPKLISLPHILGPTGGKSSESATVQSLLLNTVLMASCPKLC